MMIHPRRFASPWLLFLLLETKMATGDFGDYVDPTFDCPAMTTCRQVCVPRITLCPIEMLCRGNETLCADGSCAEECSTDLISPCQSDCAPVACKKVVHDLPTCTYLYTRFYDFEDTCANTDVDADRYDYREVGFVFFYCWITIMTAAILAWCAYNHRFARPVKLDSSGEISMEKNDPVASKTPQEAAPKAEQCGMWQTGYKIHPVGSVIHACTLLTLAGIHGLLVWLSIQYYVNQGLITKLKQQFDDEEQLLKVFEVVWMIGFIWTFALKWPHSLETLFLRRCQLTEATHVAVRVPIESSRNTDPKNASHLHYTLRIFSLLQRWLNRMMSFIFSDIDSKYSKTMVCEYCRVQEEVNGTRFFSYRLRRYNLERNSGMFVALTWEVGHTVDDILVMGLLRSAGLSTLDVEARRSVVGKNGIEMPKPSFVRAFLHELSKPFHMYQCFIVWSWLPLYYYYMAILLGCVILTSASIVSFFQYRNESNLYQIASISGEVLVMRDGFEVTIPQEELVPGDIVHLRPGLAYGDMVLVRSTAALLVDESAVTGEATPVAKLPLCADEMGGEYIPSEYKRQTILAGTSILECEDSQAVVIKTASFTARGELLREIFSSPSYKMKFDSEKGIVLVLLFVYAIFGFSMVMYFTNESLVYGWFYGIYVVGTILPPLLPTVATVSVGISDYRLARKNITSAKVDSVLVAGKVNRVFFDKTGTLTYRGLSFVSTRSAASWTTYQLTNDMTLAMAVCHSLTRARNGMLIGNPVDRAMFKVSGACHQGNGAVVRILVAKDGLVEVVRNFDFDYQRKTQSVIVRLFDGSLIAFVKGSSESMRKICLAESFPDDFTEYIRDNAKLGMYQISFAVRRLPSDMNFKKVGRDEIEDSLTFLGVVNFKNRLREEAPSVVKELEDGGVRSVMVTGDNVLTGVCIAREAGIIQPGKMVVVGNLDSTGSVFWTNETSASVTLTTDKLKQFQNGDVQLAISGEAWVKLHATAPDEARQIMHNIRVFGRCSPQDKVSVVSAFADRGFVTLMCGDGGNDCGALKTAHVGIALSDAEASIVAPITSLDKTITAVTEVIKEGRCALASALASYKYMIMYGQVETINQLINAYFLITFSDWCWFFMDGLWTMTLAFSLPLARAAKKLSNTRPTASLLGPQTLSSVLGVLALNFIFTVSALAYLFHQDWYQCRKWKGQNIANILNIGDNYETEVIFLVTGFQYICSAMTYNFGYEFRQAWIRNYVFVTLAVVYTTLQFYITVNPGKLSCLFRVNCENEDVVPSLLGTERVPIQNSFNTTVMPADFCRGLLGIMITNAIVIAAWDYFAVNGTRRYFAAKRRRASAAVEQ